MKIIAPRSRVHHATLLVATAALVSRLVAADQPPTISGQFPADNAALTVSRTALRVTPTDPENQPLTVTFYASGGDQAIPGPDFTFGTFPDTQYYSANGTGESCPPDQNGALSAIYYQQTQWYANNRSSKNIAFLAHMGDYVNNGDWCDMQWQIANRAMLTVESPAATGLTFGIPWGGAPGNHDQGAGPGVGRGMASAQTNKYNQYFGTARFSGRPYWGGNYGTNNDNNYQFFSTGGYDFVVINLEYYNASLDPGYDFQSVLDWADAVLKAHPTRRGIVTNHHLETNDGTFSATGQLIYDALKDNPNLFLMLGGHVGISPSATPQHTVTYNGNTVRASLQDYQSEPNGGNGWLRYFVFSPTDKKIYAWTYSPYLNQYGNGSSAPHFSWNYDMAKAVGGWVMVGTVTVASGAQAQLTWTGLAPNQNYTWYAKISDGTNTVLTPVRTVNTGPMAQTFTSIAAHDGWLLESTASSGVGGTMDASNATTSALRAGDSNANKKYKSVVSFDTSALPDNAQIASATLKLRRGSMTGTNPFTTHGTCYVDIKGGTGFGGATALAITDYEAAADAIHVAVMSNATSNGAWSSGALDATGQSFINKAGHTQLRVYFNIGDNGDGGADYIGWYSGNDATAGNRPVLEITWQ